MVALRGAGQGRGGARQWQGQGSGTQHSVPVIALPPLTPSTSNSRDLQRIAAFVIKNQGPVMYLCPKEMLRHDGADEHANAILIIFTPSKCTCELVRN